MSRPVIQKLGYPLWFNILFFLLTIAVPIGLVISEGLKAPSTPTGVVFKVSFMVTSGAIVAWFFIEKFLIKNIETKLVLKQSALEHDYSIRVGDPEAIRFLWHRNEMTLTIFNLISSALYGGLLIIIMLGVSSALIKITGLVVFVLSAYLIAYTIKFVYLMIRRGNDV